MALIHRTTMVPTKLDLLTRWLPDQPWYRAAGAPQLDRAGGFRLDDPAGEVGIEFMFVIDTSAGVTYHVPLSYRGAPLAGAGAALVGTAEHGVLGRRWIYDGTGDPVVVTQLLALVQGQAQAQAQSETDTPDHSVGRHPARSGMLVPSGPAQVASTDRRTTLTVPVEAGTDPVLVQVVRILDGEPDGAAAPGWVAADYRRPDRTPGRGRVILVR